VAEKLVKALCVSKEVDKEERSDSYRNAVLAIDREELRTFLEALNNDYTRSIQFERIRTSIENQNVKAKVVLKDGQYLLKPSFADHKVKSAIFDFMLGFADGTEEERSDLLNYMRGLIVLYVCGPVVYNELAENGIRLKDFADPYINKDLVFCPKAAEIFKEEEPKGLKRRLRGAYEYELVKHYKEALHVFALEAENDLSEGMEEETRKGAIEEKIRNERYWLDFIEKEVKGEPDVPGNKGNCETCRYKRCRYCGMTEEQLPDWMK
jgi:hypothetical protein